MNCSVAGTTSAHLAFERKCATILCTVQLISYADLRVDTSHVIKVEAKLKFEVEFTVTTTSGLQPLYSVQYYDTVV